jgi:hypothetical protein
MDEISFYENPALFIVSLVIGLWLLAGLWGICRLIYKVWKSWKK